MSDPYIVSGLVSMSVDEEKITSTIFDTLVDRNYILFTGSQSNKSLVKDKRGAIEAIVSENGLMYELKIDDSQFFGSYNKPSKINSKMNGWKIFLTFSNKFNFVDSYKYLNEIEKISQNICGDLPVKTIYGIGDLQAASNIDLADDSVEKLTSICYFSNEMMQDGLRDKIRNAPIYHTDEVGGGLYVRLGETLNSISSANRREVADATGLDVSV